jgi:hypothetical protein
MSWSNGIWIDDEPFIRTRCPGCWPSSFEPGKEDFMAVYCSTHLQCPGLDDGKVETGGIVAGCEGVGSEGNAAMCAIVHKSRPKPVRASLWKGRNKKRRKAR